MPCAAAAAWWNRSSTWKRIREWPSATISSRDENSGATHLHALAAISRLMRDERVHEALSDAPNQEALYGLLTNATDRDAA